MLVYVKNRQAVLFHCHPGQANVMVRLGFQKADIHTPVTSQAATFDAEATEKNRI